MPLLWGRRPPRFWCLPFQMPDRLPLFLLCRNQFTSGDCVSSESGSRPRWNRPHEHWWTAACPGVPTTGPGYHTGNAAEPRSTFIPGADVIRMLECRACQIIWLYMDSQTACWNVWERDCLFISLRLACCWSIFRLCRCIPTPAQSEGLCSLMGQNSPKMAGLVFLKIIE